MSNFTFTQNIIQNVELRGIKKKKCLFPSVFEGNSAPEMGPSTAPVWVTMVSAWEWLNMLWWEA